MVTANITIGIFIRVILSLLVGLIGRKRKIGFGWTFLICIIITPIIGIIAALCSKKADNVKPLDISNLWKKEDWLAVWIGFIVIAGFI